ncbi:unnamed protein product [marine sediment metagenome]|uniref:Uncharacterized protein n=1 Tax=marine sediment metagenome TaxID=412755 RepID=X0Z6S2_9ZZZZ
MKHLIRKLIRKFKRQPDMLDVCECGHLFEEHDWGAYSNLSTRYSSACLVKDCRCDDFKRRGYE